MNDFENIESLKRQFNWGAFFLGWIWGLFNKTYITLIQIPITFIPYIGVWINLGLSIFFGIKGNTWALEKKEFSSSMDFEKFQKILTCAGILVQVTMIILGKIFIELSALHPPDYDFSITTKLIKTLIFILLAIYLLVIVFILKMSEKNS